MPPNMTPAELERWASRQIDAAIARGSNPIDSANAVKRFLSKLPPGADPDSYVPNDYGAGVDASSKEVLADARADWYGKVDAKNARLLDAKGTG